MVAILKTVDAKVRVEDHFYAIPPFAKDAAEQSRVALLNRPFPRHELFQILSAYQQQIGNQGAEVSAQLDRLAQADSICVVTGQQVGFMTGPAYTFSKAITCLLLARQYNAVPIFWAATEDHDIHEINSATVISERGDLHQYGVKLREGLAAEDQELTPEHVEEARRFFNRVGLDQSLLSGLVTGQSYGQAMVALLARAFAGTGLLFVEPRLLRTLTVDLVVNQLTSSEQIRQKVARATETLRQLGAACPLEVREGETWLFARADDGRRLKIKRDEMRVLFGSEQLTMNGAIERLHSQPARISSGVAFRPVVQSAVIPTFAYVAGPTELQYWAQLKELFASHHVPMPWCVQRMSLTLIPEPYANWLERLGLNPLGAMPSSWRELTREDSVPTHALHALNNLLRPRGRLQERVLNWWSLQGLFKEPLIPSLLNILSWESAEHIALC